MSLRFESYGVLRPLSCSNHSTVCWRVCAASASERVVYFCLSVSCTLSQSMLVEAERAV